MLDAGSAAWLEGLYETYLQNVQPGVQSVHQAVVHRPLPGADVPDPTGIAVQFLQFRSMKDLAFVISYRDKLRTGYSLCLQPHSYARPPHRPER